MDHATQPVLSMQTIAPASLAEFARLIPADRAAMIAFDHVASKMKADPAWNRHARKYMSIYPEKTVFEFVGSDSESESGLGPQAQRRLIWRGFYRFDLDTPPQDPRCGWLLGGGKFASSDESPELVLTERKAHDLMFGRHARLFHNYSSGALVLGLGDRSFAVVDGKVVRDSIAIWSINTRITLGTLTYKLQLDGAPEAVHRARLIRYQHTHGLEAEDLPVSLLSTPAESDFIHKDYVIKNAVGHGGSSTVFAGEHIKTGAVVAIKRITRNHSNAGQIQQEIEMATILGRHVRHL